MARIILGSYMVRYPLGGMMSWALQYLVGLQRLGHEVYFVEKSGYLNACYDPTANVMTDDCTYGVGVLEQLLARFGLDESWCYVDESKRYFGLPQPRIESVFRSADLFLDMGTHGNWLEEASQTRTVLVDGEPGFTQMKRHLRTAAGKPLPEYDFYFTTGQNIGREGNAVPAAETWRHLFHPVVVDLFQDRAPDPAAPFTTVMNWQSYEPLEFQGTTYAHKDVEFEKFLRLPEVANRPLEVACAGAGGARGRLVQAGWSVRSAHDITLTFDGFADYLLSSAGEFGVCKNGFVATRSGWFSDRSAAYLASGRPVVLQDTGFSEHLPCGDGLFAVDTVEEAAEAIRAIDADYRHHHESARRIAVEFLDARKVLGRMLEEIGL